MLIFYDVSFLIGVGAFLILGGFGALAGAFNWIAENRVGFIIISLAVLCIKAFVSAVRAKKKGANSVAVFIASIVCYIPLMIFFMVLTNNIINETFGVLSVFTYIGRLFVSVMMIGITGMGDMIISAETKSKSVDVEGLFIGTMMTTGITVAILLLYIFW